MCNCRYIQDKKSFNSSDLKEIILKDSLRIYEHIKKITYIRSERKITEDICKKPEGECDEKRLSEFLTNKVTFSNTKDCIGHCINIDNLYGIDEKFIVTKKVVSILFKKYKEIINEDVGKKINFDTHKMILEKFENVMKSIKYNSFTLEKILQINSDNIDILSELSHGYSVRESINDLIDELTRLLDSYNEKNNQFVIIVNNFPKSMNVEGDSICNLSINNVSTIILEY